MDNDCQHSNVRDVIMRREAAAIGPAAAWATFLALAMVAGLLLAPQYKPVAYSSPPKPDQYPRVANTAVALSKKVFEERRAQYIKNNPQSEVARDSAAPELVSVQRDSHSDPGYAPLAIGSE